MIIRQAIPDDFSEILELVHEFHSEGIDEYGIFCNDDVVNSIMPNLYKTSLVMEIDYRVQGVIAGYVTNHIMNKEPIYHEVMWFVSKKYRLHGIKLLKALEDMCKGMGIKQIIMVNMGSLKNEAFGKFYTSQGYRLLETHYLKKLK